MLSDEDAWGVGVLVTIGYAMVLLLQRAIGVPWTF